MRTLVQLVPALAAALAAAPALAAETESRPTTAFHAIHVRNGVELTVRHGDGPSLSITGERDELPGWRTDVADGVLSIEPRSGRRGSHGVSVTVTTPSLDALEASGGVRVTLGPGLGRRLAVEASGGADLAAKALELDVLELAASGGASLELAGSAAEVRAELSGGVDLDARRLVADRVKLEASGGCKLRVHARESVTGRASGGVGVEIHGRPREALVSTSGGSKVEYRE